MIPYWDVPFSVSFRVGWWEATTSASCHQIELYICRASRATVRIHWTPSTWRFMVSWTPMPTTTLSPTTSRSWHNRRAQMSTSRATPRLLNWHSFRHPGGVPCTPSTSPRRPYGWLGCTTTRSWRTPTSLSWRHRVQFCSISPNNSKYQMGSFHVKRLPTLLRYQPAPSIVTELPYKETLWILLGYCMCW